MTSPAVAEPGTRYDGALTMREARAHYFAANGFGDGGYDARWVRLQAGPVPLYFPNTAGRVRAVRFHDLHHVLTEYETTWTGEAEIAAWEIASSCADHYAAWLLNLSALAIGLALDPAAMLRAFVRGRRSRNLYRARFDDRLLAARVASLRHELDLDRKPGPATIAERVGFAVWATLSVLTLAVLVVVPIVAIASLLSALV